MPLRKFVEKFTKPVEEQDREQLRAWCEQRGGTPLDAVQLRRPVRVVGEISSVRIVPRAGAAAVEATVSDGHGAVTAVFLGRRKVPGLSPGRRVMLQGVVASQGKGEPGVIYNPVYQLL